MTLTTPGEAETRGGEVDRSPWLFVSWAGDLGQRMQTLAQSGQDVEVKKVRQRVEKAAQDCWVLWAQAQGGSTVDCQGQTGTVKVPLKALAQVAQQRQRFIDDSEIKRQTMRVGLGRSMDQSTAALKYAQKTGSPTVYWTPSIPRQLADGEAVQKAVRPDAPVAPDAPVSEGSEHSEAEGLRGAIAAEVSGAPPPPETTHAADLLADFKGLAQQPQGGGDGGPQDELAAVRAKLATVLEDVRRVSPALAQLKASSPRAWESVQNLVSAVIALGRVTSKLSKGEQVDARDMFLQRRMQPTWASAVRKSDEETPEDIEGLAKAIRDIPVGQDVAPMHPALHSHTTDYSHVLPPGLKDRGYALHVHHDGPGSDVLQATVHHNGQRVGGLVGDVNPHKGLVIGSIAVDKGHEQQGLGTALYESMMAHGMHALGLTHVQGDRHSTSASATHAKVSGKHGMDYQASLAPGAEATPVQRFDNRFGSYQYALKEELGMAKAEPPSEPPLPNPFAASGMTPHQWNDFPVTLKDGRKAVVRVKPEPPTGWIRAAGQPVSASRPYPDPSVKVHVKSADGDHIAHAGFGSYGQGIGSTHSWVHEAFRRQGVASHMYDLAEKAWGQKAVPTNALLDDGAAFWGARAQKAELPQAKPPPLEHHLDLPPGSMHEGGPGADRHRVGKVKVQHGNGRESWVQARAGMVTAVADRHARPVLGANAHPISSRNQSGH